MTATCRRCPKPITYHASNLREYCDEHYHGWMLVRCHGVSNVLEGTFDRRCNRTGRFVHEGLRYCISHKPDGALEA